MGTARDGRGTRRASTRRDILAAAEELVLENGLSGLRTKDLVLRSGVSERTVFNNFDSIEDTALTRIEEYLTPLFSDLDVPTETPVEQLPAVVRDRVLTHLATPAGLECLTGFVRLAAALAPDSGEVLTRHVVLTLTSMGSLASSEVEETRPELSVEQQLRLRLYLSNLALAMGLGLARAALHRLPKEVLTTLEVRDRIPPAEELVPHIEWAFQQVDAGLPQL
ncbi:TetR/AcrR family transcriptional regulator [Kocuria rhizophila]|uniref:TetR/AcrR family transcriptional regulator n=2 Tax=Kocuria rhizophila TaxID=72000 RepID=A0AAX2SDP8_KOCRH|nr:TetR/AcrR family transcriptional regulator [Kocuria rhizophila]TFI01334.1 TetR/AcrR family transcriptional regulator [Kocuria rhizophila]TFI09564.1 TetR/AcrR family transcriptional regulator [Kocuria rhizophila]